MSRLHPGTTKKNSATAANANASADEGKTPAVQSSQLQLQSPSQDASEGTARPSMAADIGGNAAAAADSVQTDAQSTSQPSVAGLTSQQQAFLPAPDAHSVRSGSVNMQQQQQHEGSKVQISTTPTEPEPSHVQPGAVAEASSVTNAAVEQGLSQATGAQAEREASHKRPGSPSRAPDGTGTVQPSPKRARADSTKTTTHVGDSLSSVVASPAARIASRQTVSSPVPEREGRQPPQTPVSAGPTQSTLHAGDSLSSVEPTPSNSSIHPQSASNPASEIQIGLQSPNKPAPAEPLLSLSSAMASPDASNIHPHLASNPASEIPIGLQSPQKPAPAELSTGTMHAGESLSSAMASPDASNIHLQTIGSPTSETPFGLQSPHKAAPIETSEHEHPAASLALTIAAIEGVQVSDIAISPAKKMISKLDTHTMHIKALKPDLPVPAAPSTGPQVSELKSSPAPEDVGSEEPSHQAAEAERQQPLLHANGTSSVTRPAAGVHEMPQGLSSLQGLGPNPSANLVQMKKERSTGLTCPSADLMATGRLTAIPHESISPAEDVVGRAQPPLNALPAEQSPEAPQKLSSQALAAIGNAQASSSLNFAKPPADSLLAKDAPIAKQTTNAADSAGNDAQPSSEQALDAVAKDVVKSPAATQAGEGSAPISQKVCSPVLGHGAIHTNHAQVLIQGSQTGKSQAGLLPHTSADLAAAEEGKITPAKPVAPAHGVTEKADRLSVAVKAMQDPAAKQPQPFDSSAGRLTADRAPQPSPMPSSPVLADTSQAQAFSVSESAERVQMEPSKSCSPAKPVTGNPQPIPAMGAADFLAAAMKMANLPDPSSPALRATGNALSSVEPSEPLPAGKSEATPSEAGTSGPAVIGNAQPSSIMKAADSPAAAEGKQCPAQATSPPLGANGDAQPAPAIEAASSQSTAENEMTPPRLSSREPAVTTNAQPSPASRILQSLAAADSQMTPAQPMGPTVAVTGKAEPFAASRVESSLPSSARKMIPSKLSSPALAVPDNAEPLSATNSASPLAAAESKTSPIKLRSPALAVPGTAQPAPASQAADSRIATENDKASSKPSSLPLGATGNAQQSSASKESLAAVRSPMTPSKLVHPVHGITDNLQPSLDEAQAVRTPTKPDQFVQSSADLLAAEDDAVTIEKLQSLAVDAISNSQPPLASAQTEVSKNAAIAASMTDDIAPAGIARASQQTSRAALEGENNITQPLSQAPPEQQAAEDGPSVAKPPAALLFSSAPEAPRLIEHEASPARAVAGASRSCSSPMLAPDKRPHGVTSSHLSKNPIPAQAAEAPRPSDAFELSQIADVQSSSAQIVGVGCTMPASAVLQTTSTPRVAPPAQSLMLNPRPDMSLSAARQSTDGTLPSATRHAPAGVASPIGKVHNASQGSIIASLAQPAALVAQQPLQGISSQASLDNEPAQQSMDACEQGAVKSAATMSPAGITLPTMPETLASQSAAAHAVATPPSSVASKEQDLPQSRSALSPSTPAQSKARNSVPALGVPSMMAAGASPQAIAPGAVVMNQAEDELPSPAFNPAFAKEVRGMQHPHMDGDSSAGAGVETAEGPAKALGIASSRSPGKPPSASGQSAGNPDARSLVEPTLKGLAVPAIGVVNAAAGSSIPGNVMSTPVRQGPSSTADVKSEDGDSAADPQSPIFAPEFAQEVARMLHAGSRQSSPGTPSSSCPFACRSIAPRGGGGGGGGGGGKMEDVLEPRRPMMQAVSCPS